MSETAVLKKSESSAFVAKTFGWMALALLISAAAAWVTSQSPAMLKFLFSGKKIAFWGLCIIDLVLVFMLSANVRKMSLSAVVAAFLAYSVIDGITLSSIFLRFKLDSIASAFLCTALVFGGMSFYGVTTKRNLNTLAHYLMMGLFGIIIAGGVQFLISLFSHADFSMFNLVISIITIIVFTGLTAVDSQKLMQIAVGAKNNDDYKKVSIMAALELYLDFINILLALLRLKRADD